MSCPDFHETDEVNVVYERQAYNHHDLREGAAASDAPREYNYEQVGYEHYPSLYLYGINAVSIEETYMAKGNFSFPIILRFSRAMTGT